MRLIRALMTFAALEQRASGDAGRRKDDIAAHHIGDGVDVVGVFDAHLSSAVFFFFAVEDEAALHLASDASQSGGGEHTLRRATDAHIDVNAGAGWLGGMDDAGDIAIGDEIDGSASLADGLDEAAVARAVEDASGDIFGLDAARFGQRFDVVLRGLVEGDGVVGEAGADGDFFHIDIGRMEEAVARRDGGHRERIGHGFGGEGGAFERIDGDIDGCAALSDLFADEEHGGLIAFALADDDFSAHVHEVESGAHSGDGDFIGLMFIAAADLAVRGDGGAFGRMDEAEHKIGANLVFLILIPHVLFICDLRRILGNYMVNR